MTESKFTSGPWEVHEHQHVGGDFWCSIGYRGWGPITDIVGGQGNKVDEECHHDWCMLSSPFPKCRHCGILWAELQETLRNS